MWLLLAVSVCVWMWLVWLRLWLALAEAVALAADPWWPAGLAAEPVLSAEVTRLTLADSSYQ